MARSGRRRRLYGGPLPSCASTSAGARRGPRAAAHGAPDLRGQRSRASRSRPRARCRAWPPVGRWWRWPGPRSPIAARSTPGPRLARRVPFIQEAQGHIADSCRGDLGLLGGMTSTRSRPGQRRAGQAERARGPAHARLRPPRHRGVLGWAESRKRRSWRGAGLSRTAPGARREPRAARWWTLGAARAAEWYGAAAATAPGAAARARGGVLITAGRASWAAICPRPPPPRGTVYVLDNWHRLHRQHRAPKGDRGFHYVIDSVMNSR